MQPSGQLIATPTPPPRQGKIVGLWHWLRRLSWRVWLAIGLVVVAAAIAIAYFMTRSAPVADTTSGQAANQSGTQPSGVATTPPATSPPNSGTAQKPETPPAKQPASQPTTNGGSQENNTGTNNNSTSSSPAFPDETTTGVPAGVTLHSCPTTIVATATYDACLFSGGLSVRANNVQITRSLITGQVDTGEGGAGEQSGLVISDSTINCGCQSVDDTHTPAAILYSNFTLLRVNIYNAGHGAAVDSNVTIKDSYIHGLGGNTEAHKDGIYSGNGTNVTLRHNTIECNDGPLAGCTAAIGLLTDFSDITYYTIDNNLLNTNGAYCFYGSGGPGKTYGSNHLTFINNHFGRKYKPQCGDLGPVTYFDINQPGMVWSGNVWDDTGEVVGPVY